MQWRPDLCNEEIHVTKDSDKCISASFAIHSDAARSSTGEIGLVTSSDLCVDACHNFRFYLSLVAAKEVEENFMATSAKE